MSRLQEICDLQEQVRPPSYQLQKRREHVMDAWPARVLWELTVGSKLRAILGKLQV